MGSIWITLNIPGQEDISLFVDVIIMTSNLGTEEFQRQAIGFAREEKGDTQRLKSAVDNALKRAFRPEFLNRIDDIITFEPLTEEHLKKIVDLLIKEVQNRLVERRIELDLNSEAKAWLLKEGYDPIFGARPLRRAIQRYVENPLSNRILSGDFKDGDTVYITVKDEKLSFSSKKPSSVKEKVKTGK